MSEEVKKKKPKKISVYDLKLHLRFSTKKSAEKARSIILRCLNKEMKEIPKQVLFPDENIEGFK